MADELDISAVDLLGGDDNATTTTDQSTDTTTTPPVFDPSVLGKDIGEHVARALESRLPQKQEQKKELTAEEAKKLLNLWEPDDAFVTRFSNLETQKAAIVEMRDKLTAQMYAIIRLHGDELRQGLQAEYAPALEYVRTKDVADREDRFFTANPDLKEPAMRPILEAVTQHLSNAGKLGKDESANFKAIADGVEAVIKSHNPNFVRQAAAPQKKSSSSSNGLPVTTPGGGGGGGNQGQQKEYKSKAVGLLS